MSISQRCINSDTRVILSEVLVIMHIDHDHDLFEFKALSVSISTKCLADTKPIPMPRPVCQRLEMDRMFFNQSSRKSP